MIFYVSKTLYFNIIIIILIFIDVTINYNINNNNIIINLFFIN